MHENGSREVDYARSKEDKRGYRVPSGWEMVATSDSVIFPINSRTDSFRQPFVDDTELI